MLDPQLGFDLQVLPHGAWLHMDFGADRIEDA